LDPNYAKKRIDLCGNAIVDFLNADTTDEACISLIPKIQIEYKFSPNFTKNAHNKFPFLDHIFEPIEDDLHQGLRRMIDLHFKYWAELDLIDYAVEKLCLRVDEYDFRNDKLILLTEQEGKKVRIPLKDVDKNYKKIKIKIKNSCEVPPSPAKNSIVESWENTQQGFELYDHITNIRKYAKLIPKVSGPISAAEEKVGRYLLKNELLLAHSNIYLKQVILKKVFDRVINGIRLDRYFPFHDIISSYLQSLGPSIEILPEGNLKFNKPIKREKFFTQYYKPLPEQDDNRDYYGVGAKNLEAYMSAINHFFVEFLKTYNNINRFHCCKYCDKYFISNTKRKAKFCSKKCRQDWNNTKRIQSGEHREYKRKKRLEGAKESYYG
jgi:hypothetical protein